MDDCNGGDDRVSAAQRTNSISKVHKTQFVTLYLEIVSYIASDGDGVIGAPERTYRISSFLDIRNGGLSTGMEEVTKRRIADLADYYEARIS
jgi:hypothetical protein